MQRNGPDDVGQHAVVFHTSQHPYTPRRRQRRKYRDKLSVIGAFLMFFGMASAIMAPYALGQETGVVYYKRGPYFVLNQILQGLWVGVFMTASGILGLCALRNQSYSMYVANIVLSVITVVLETVGLIIAFVGAALAWNRAIILHVLITISIFLGLCLCIAQAWFACKGIRRQGPPRQPSGMYLNTNIPIGSVGEASSNSVVTRTTSPSAQYSNFAVGTSSTEKGYDHDPPPPYPG